MAVRCNRCVMDDSSDSTISFNPDGTCNYCTEALKGIGRVYFPNEEGAKRLESLLSQIKEEGKGKKYDCIMGISGGLDSSYLAYLGYKWGLRILAVHIDDGYDTEISKENIKKLIDKCHIETRTIKPDEKQFDDLTHAYMRAGVPNLAVPQDNILLAFLYKTALSENIKYFLSGGNFALECILQRGNTYNSLDVKNIRAINRKNGNGKLDKLRFITSYDKYILEKTGRLVTYRPLNYIDYNRDRAFEELRDFCGFEYYGRKHLENKLTAFLQLYWLPERFGVDKRTSHLSSMIVSGQMTRQEALKELDEPMYDEEMMRGYSEEIKQRMGISDEEFESLMKAPVHQHEEYSHEVLGKALHRILHSHA